MYILAGISVPEGHPLARWGMRLRIWSQSSAAAGAFTAGVVVGLAWLPWAIACFLLFGDRSYMPFLVIAATDLGLRLWGVRSTFLMVPFSLWSIAMLAVVIYAEHN